MNFYEILKTKKLGRGSPDYWTQLFAEHVGGKGEWKVAGVLPLAFTAKSGTAVDWVIEGNDENGTENLFDIPNITVTGYNNYYAGYAFSDTLATTILTEINANIGSQYSWYINIDTEYTGNVFFTLVLQYADGTYVSFINPHTFTPAKEVTRVELRAQYNSENGKGYQYTFSDITLVKGSTAPDHYIPYQQGVGERTKNLLEITAETQTINGVTFTVDETMGTITADGMENSNTTIGINNYITVNATGSYILSGCPAEGSPQTWEVTIQNGNTIVGRARPNPATVTLTAGVLYTVRCVVRNRVRCDNLVYKPMVRKANTSDTFVPYGYQIPLAVSQQGQPDKTVDIYIGDSPLTEGETVSKTSTGVDIELFEGENTVSTTLYNKPTMEIKYIKRR